jgi:poly(hydroxyalkanoate) depolymerase family esterase
LRNAGAFLKRLLSRPTRAFVPPLQPEEPRAREEAVAPQEGRWLAGDFSNFAGRRQYRLYVPGGHRGRKMPLIVMLHGCRQWPEDFAAGTGMNRLAEEQGFLVAYPEQPRSANGLRCWNWFNSRHQHRGRGEPSLIAGITRDVMERYNADPERVYIAGLSAGGALSSVMAATYPDLYAAVGVHAGLARGAARNVPSAYSAMQRGTGTIAPEVALSSTNMGGRRNVPMIIFHGDQDETVHPRNSPQVLEQAWPQAYTLLRHDKTQQRVKGGHSYTRTRYFDKRWGRPLLEHWLVHDAGHAWMGGSSAGSYTDPQGPDASVEMVRFFLSHKLENAVAAEEAAI